MWAGVVVTVCSAGIAVCGRARGSNLPGRPACCSRSASCMLTLEGLQVCQRHAHTFLMKHL